MYSEYANSWRRISVTALHDFSSDELEYFECQYPEDLEHVFALLGADISLVIFTRAMHPPSRPKMDRTFPPQRAQNRHLILFISSHLDQSVA